MESILPLYPGIEDEQASPQETRLERPIQPIRVERVHPSHPQITNYGPGPSLPTSHSQPREPYSPTKTELESHPIRQRLSIQGDEITTGLGSAPEVPLELDRWSRPAAEELAQEVDRNAPGAMADTTIKEGDAGTFATLHEI